MKCIVALAHGVPASGSWAIRPVEAERIRSGAADGSRRWFRNARRNALGEASAVWFARIMWRCGQIWTWGPRLGDKCPSTLLARSTVLLAARPEQRISVRSAAINAMVIRRIMVMALPRLRLANCGSGLMLAIHEADFPHDDALVRGVTAPDRRGGAVRVGASSPRLARPQARAGARKPNLAAPADPALERLTWQARRLRRRPEACIASRRTTCRNAHL